MIGYTGQGGTGRHEVTVREVTVRQERREATPFELSYRISAHGAVVTIRGEMDLATAERAYSYVSDVIGRHDGEVSLDLSGLAFCDVSGLNALVRMVGRAERAGSRLWLTAPPESLAKLMRITGVDRRFPRHREVAVSAGAVGR
jgi:anti-sigma B factor antagonist